MSTAVLDYRSIIQPKVQYKLWNPAPNDVERDVSAVTFVIPAGGTLDITGLPAAVTDGKGNALPRGSSSYREALSAEQILSHLVGEDGRTGKLGPLGVRCLFGDERDELVKEEGRETWELWQYQNDLRAEYAHNKAIQTAKEAGLPPPPPTRETREKIARRVAYERDSQVVPTHPCPSCQWPCFSEDELRSHDISTHQRGTLTTEASPVSTEIAELKATVAALQSIVAAALTVNATKARRGRKPKAASEEAA